LKGVYTLIIRFLRPCKTRIGRHRTVALPHGLYVYTGSGVGRGSTSLEGRVQRHLRRKKRKLWHIDRILACQPARVMSVVFAEATARQECRVNAAFMGDLHFRLLQSGIGSSDCQCESHFLLAKESLRPLLCRVRSHYLELGLTPLVLRNPNTQELWSNPLFT